jgi:hypothetical protein
MRSLLLLAVVLSACGVPYDPLVGSFNFTLTGTEMQTMPSNQNSTTTGTGTIAITHGIAEKSYVLTVAETDSNPCTLRGTRNEMDPNTIDIASAQMCHFTAGGGSITATLNASTAKLTLGPGSMPGADTIKLDVTYSYSGTVLGFQFSGTGTRSYQGARY